MNGRDLLTAMGYVDEAMVEAAAAERPGRRRFGKWMLTAACICLLAVSVMAVELLDSVRVEELDSRGDQSSYLVSWDVERIPADEFSDGVSADMRELLEEQSRGIFNREDIYSGEQYYLTWEDMESYLGISVPNPLEEQDWLKHSGRDAWADGLNPSAVEDYDRCHTCLWITGTWRGRVRDVLISAGYRAGRTRLILRTMLYSEYADSSAMRYIWEEQLTEFETETQKTGSGKAAQLVFPEGENYAYGYVSGERAAYTLQVLTPPTGWTEEVLLEMREVLYRALECF